MAKSQAYQDTADAPVTLRAYATDWANFAAWCAQHGFTAMPATPEAIGAYLAAAGEGYALATLRRRVAAVVRACRITGHALDTKHPATCEILRGIGRKHGTPARRSADLTYSSEPAMPELKDLGKNRSALTGCGQASYGCLPQRRA